jgi:hypothetical protein
MKVRPISIWAPRRTGGELTFVRPEPSPFGDHYAATRVLPARKAPGRRRVCVFGESVAAGYLYAPHLSAASALAAWLTELSELAGPSAYEVVDLARTNETLDGLAATVEASLQLDPDLLVLFAGNNWNLLETPEVSPYAPSADDRRTYAAALAQAGVAGPVGLARRNLDGRARSALDRIAEVTREARMPVVVVVPEVNLADWESRQPPVWLPGDGVARWFGALDAARAALSRKDAAAAEDAAWRMIALDESSGPVPFRLLARAWAARGREAEARDAALAEVDAVHYPLLCFLAAPQATTAARSLLAEAAVRHGWTAVDLRPVFAAHTGSLLPGRRLFLDYCHLTSEGMRVALAAVAVEAARLAPRPGGSGARAGAAWTDLLRGGGGPAVAPEAEATARIGAAVHGAHRLLATGRLAPHLEPWCTEALALSPAAADTFVDLAEARAAAVPAGLTAAVRRILASPHPLGFQHGLQWQGLDADVLLAAAAALRRGGRPDAAAEVERRLVERGLGPDGIDLARGRRHLAEPLARPYPEAIDAREQSGRSALRCPWPETSFWLPVAEPEATVGVTLRLTARLPPIPGAEGCRRGPSAVRIDGEAAGFVVLGERWTRGTFRVPAGRLRPGLHRVTVAWPMPPPVGGAALEGAHRRLELGIDADLHPIFGEVFALRAERS